MHPRRTRTPRAKKASFLQGLDVSFVEDVRNLFKELIGNVLENGLEGEPDEELGYSRYDYRNKNTDNSRNGHSLKNLKTSFGETEIEILRDRRDEFEPNLVKKHQTSISGDIDEKILSMYAKGMTTSDIESRIREIYGISVSDSTISRITDKVLPVVKEWQSRPLESVYPAVFMGAVHFHVRSEGQVVKKAVYVAIGIQLDGVKDVLGMWVGENERVLTASFVRSPSRSRYSRQAPAF